MKRIVALCLMIGCTGTPKIRYSQLEYSHQPETVFEGEKTNERDRLTELITTVSGAQFGDAIFKRSTPVYWVLPEIDRLDLAVTGRTADFTADEFQKRQRELEEQHQNNFVFALDLRMPFLSSWSKEKLIEFLQSNLIISLENGTRTIYQPSYLLFHIQERFGNDPPVVNSDDLEVGIPLRVLFNKAEVLAPNTNEITLKLRLRQTPPFRIGFFDDKFFQGYRWKISPDAKIKKPPALLPGARREEKNEVLEETVSCAMYGFNVLRWVFVFT